MPAGRVDPSPSVKKGVKRVRNRQLARSRAVKEWASSRSRLGFRHFRKRWHTAGVEALRPQLFASQ
jgi:hypothetical protein